MFVQHFKQKKAEIPEREGILRAEQPDGEDEQGASNLQIGAAAFALFALIVVTNDGYSLWDELALVFCIGFALLSLTALFKLQKQHKEKKVRSKKLPC